MTKYQSFEWQNMPISVGVELSDLIHAAVILNATDITTTYVPETQLLQLHLGLSDDTDMTQKVVDLCDGAKLARPTSKIDSGCGINLRSAEDVRLATPTADKAVEVKTPVEPKAEPVVEPKVEAMDIEVAAPQAVPTLWQRIKNFFKGLL